jgi:hypothetical protein
VPRVVTFQSNAQACRIGRRSRRFGTPSARTTARTRRVPAKIEGSWIEASGRSHRRPPNPRAPKHNPPPMREPESDFPISNPRTELARDLSKEAAYQRSIQRIFILLFLNLEI